MEEKFYRCAQAAKFIGVSTTQMHRLDTAGELVPQRLTLSGQREYSEKQLQYYKKIHNKRMEIIQLKRVLRSKDKHPVDMSKNPDEHKRWSLECLALEEKILNCEAEIKNLKEKSGAEPEEEFQA